MNTEPQQPGKREALARALMVTLGCQVQADDADCIHADDSMPCRCDTRYAWCAVHDWEEPQPPGATICSYAARLADAALAHLAERRAGDVEAVRKIADEVWAIAEYVKDPAHVDRNNIAAGLRRLSSMLHELPDQAALTPEDEPCACGLPMWQKPHHRSDHGAPTRGVSAEQVEAAEEAVRGYSSSAAHRGTVVEVTGVDPETVRVWAREHGLQCSDTGRLRKRVIDAYVAAHAEEGAA